MEPIKDNPNETKDEPMRTVAIGWFQFNFYWLLHWLISVNFYWFFYFTYSKPTWIIQWSHLLPIWCKRKKERERRDLTSTSHPMLTNHWFPWSSHDIINKCNNSPKLLHQWMQPNWQLHACIRALLYNKFSQIILL